MIVVDIPDDDASAKYTEVVGDFNAAYVGVRRHVPKEERKALDDATGALLDYLRVLDKMSVQYKQAKRHEQTKAKVKRLKDDAINGWAPTADHVAKLASWLERRPEKRASVNAIRHAHAFKDVYYADQVRQVVALYAKEFPGAVKNEKTRGVSSHPVVMAPSLVQGAKH